MLVDTDADGNCKIVSRWNSALHPVTGEDWTPGEESIALQTDDGDSCPVSPSNYTFTVNFKCNVAYAVPPAADIDVMIETGSGCLVEMQYPTCWACQNKDPEYCEAISNVPSPQPQPGTSAGVVVLIIFIVLIVGYCGIGMAVGYCRGMRGIEMIPNLSFWRYVCCCKCIRGGGGYESF